MTDSTSRPDHPAGDEAIPLVAGPCPAGRFWRRVDQDRLQGDAGIRDGTLRAAKPKSGDASVLVKNVNDGTIAGKADLQRVKPTPAELIGPVAWEAMALATQQHYLAEISEKLDGIQHGVDEVLAQLNDDRVGSLNHWSEVAASAQAAARRDGRLSETRLAEVREGALRTKELWHQITTTARRQLEQYASGKSSRTRSKGRSRFLRTRCTYPVQRCTHHAAVRRCRPDRGGAIG